MGSFTSDIDAIIKSKAGSDLNNNGAIPSKGHLVRSLPEKELENNELTLIKEKLETLEMKNEQLTAYVNFLYQLISQLQTTLGERQPINETPPPASVPAQTRAHYSKKEANPILTQRELDVFNLLAEGLCAKEIACKLGISQNTVISHKKNLKAKFNAKNSAELISSMLRK